MKLGIIGSGAVGFAVGYTAARLGLVSDIKFNDKKEGLAKAQAMDIEDASSFYPHYVKMSSGSYRDMADRDIIVLATGTLDGIKDRLEEYVMYKDQVESYVKEVVDAGFDGIFIVVSNPCDLMADLVYRVSGFEKERVIGSGTALDTTRLNTTLAKLLDIDPKDVRGVTLGEHGESQFVAWSRVAIGNMSLDEYLKANPCEFSRDEVENLVRERAWRVIDGKGHTQCGIGSTVCSIIDAIVNDKKSTILVASLLEGQYGIDDIYLSTPCVIGRKGVEKVLEVELNDEEIKRIKHSEEVLKANRAKYE
ncbi:L-lactate dehydrogenase [Anaerococcus sp. NML200537]|uniref:lactate/malate family dehydrogenase n=1 Tax=Anaerococcus sp. NML200537 TaxID=2954485 RepID=UPI0022384754|nr:L-lactate dehydrogenase [Anaerococcus sp. NML200537]MCW6700928.1 L-lactate dehydrogenase [Anaerococcus sp. NML200537]